MTTKILSLVFFLICSLSYTQDLTISGTVIDQGSGQPLPGVNVIVKNTSNGSFTDFDGNFTLNNVPSGAILVFSYVGYDEKEVTVSSEEPLSISMTENAESLDEIVVIGYGTQKKKEVTGAVSSVSSTVIEDLKPTRIEQALQGQVAGVNIVSNSGSPGAASTISIRGVSTNGDSRPLILLDGARIEDLSVVNPNDIESVTVLKDATAGIYGVQASNGVILITTKGGRKNTPLRVDVNTYGGVQQTTRKIPVLNATEYGLLLNEAFAANGQPLQLPNVSELGVGTDWQDEIFETAPIFNIALTMSGGTEKSTYSYGSSFLTQDGIVGGDKSNFTRFTNRLSYNTDILENLKFNAGIIYTHSNKQNIAESGLGSVLFNALNMAPTIPVFDVDGNFSIAENLGNEVINPLAQLQNTYNRGLTTKLTGIGGLSYTFLDNFTIASNIQANWAQTKGRLFNPIAFYGSGKVFNIQRSEVVETENYFRDYLFDLLFTYENTFADAHHLTFLLGNSISQETGVFTGDRGFDIVNNSVENASIDLASDVEDINAALGRDPRFDKRLLSYFTRLQYDYKGKYLLSAVFRRDASSNFGPENKVGYFPSFSLGWNVAEEAFLQDSKMINDLKIRGSYGVLGNDRIGAFRFTSLLNGEATYVFNNELVNGAAIGAVSNPEIKWERQTSRDIGFDAQLFNSALDITFDYYKRTTDDLLVTPQVSGILGVGAPGSGAPVINGGSVENSGIELSLGYNGNFSEDTRLGLKFNLATLKNEVLFVNSANAFLAGGSFGVGQDPPSRMEAGFPIGYFRGFKTDGIFQNQAEVDSHPTLDNTVQPGDLRFVDINNDGVIDDDDKTDLGNPLPDVTLGFNLTFDYKNFDFGAYTFASVGNEIVRNYERNQPFTNRTIYYLDRWTGEGSSNSFPRVTSGANTNSLFSDFFVEDGSFVRLQNVQLGYSLSDKALESSKLEKVRFYVSATNLFTLTEYQGYDPTTSNGAPIGGGIDFGFYPNPQTFLFGMNLKF